MEKFRILIADDDADDYFIITETFNEFMQHEISHVKDGQQLLRYLNLQLKLSQPLPDLILLDINMPKIDGITALESIKGLSPLNLIPIVMYSTSSDVKQQKKCMKLGANGFVSKGCSHNEVADFVQNINVFLSELRKDPARPFVHNIKPVSNTK